MVRSVGAIRANRTGGTDVSRSVRSSLRVFRLCVVFALTAGTLTAGILIGGVPRSDVRRRGQQRCWGHRGAGIGVGIRPTRRSLLRRDPRLGGERRWQVGDRTERLDGRPAPGDLGSSYGFDAPLAISSDGTDVWVANSHSVTEMSASKGALVQVISGHKFGFDYPRAISSDGTDVWVANSEAGSVTVFPT